MLGIIQLITIYRMAELYFVYFRVFIVFIWISVIVSNDEMKIFNQSIIYFAANTDAWKRWGDMCRHRFTEDTSLILSETFMPSSESYQHLRRYQHSPVVNAGYACFMKIDRPEGDIVTLEWRLLHLGNEGNFVWVSTNTASLFHSFPPLQWRHNQRDQRLKSPAFRLFAQPFCQLLIK